MRQADDLAHRIDRAERVRDVRDGNDSRPIGQERRPRRRGPDLRRRRSARPQARVLFFAEHLPRHDVGVMLHLRDEHLVAGTHVRSSIRGGDQVDRFRGAPDEHDLARVGRADETRHRFARLFVGRGRALAEAVHAAMDVGVLGGVVMSQAVDHRLRLLRRRGVVEVDQTSIVRCAGQDREIAADRLDVELREPMAGGTVANHGGNPIMARTGRIPQLLRATPGAACSCWFLPTDDFPAAAVHSIAGTEDSGFLARGRCDGCDLERAPKILAMMLLCRQRHPGD